MGEVTDAAAWRCDEAQHEPQCVKAVLVEYACATVAALCRRGREPIVGSCERPDHHHHRFEIIDTANTDDRNVHVKGK